MKTSSRPREVGGNFASRRGHAPQQLSISDTNHHVTEAIGDMYGDDDYSKRDSRPLSFMPSPAHDSIESGIFANSPLDASVDAGNTFFDGNNSSKIRPAPLTNGNTRNQGQMSPKGASFHSGELSPTLSIRERNLSDPANAQFHLNSIDYESNPEAVAQELSNLQALRRMSMDVGHTRDPDLPSFQGGSLMPSKAPAGDDDDDDPSRLFWVPARVHPELAPMEFKTFLENRVQSIKRRSGEQKSISADGLELSDSGGSLRRKKSMLSRQINNEGGTGALGYKDGADQLGRKKSLSIPQMPELKISDLKELDVLVRDPSRAMHNLTLDTSVSQSGTGEMSPDVDVPILSQAPRMGLRRSTKTTYRRGSLMKEGRGSRRAGNLHADTDGEDSPGSSPIDGRIGYPLTKVQSEPTTTENFSRPSRGGRRLQNIPRAGSYVESTEVNNDTGKIDSLLTSPSGEYDFSLPQGALPRNNTFPRHHTPVPRIIETPPAEEFASPTAIGQTHQFPDTSSLSQGFPLPQQQQVPEPPVRSNRRPNPDRQSSSPQVVPKITPQPLNRLSHSPSPFPGNNARTGSFALSPVADERKPEKRSKKDKEEPENSGSRKTSWGWFKDGDKKEKKEKKKEEEHKRGKSKTSLEKAHDNARLDVLQSTLDTAAPRGRQSQLLDRDSTDYRLQDERKRDSSRKSSTDNKKEKDGLFSSFFGGGKKKGDRDSGGKKGSSLRTLSPEPPPRQLKADIDYNWTRFSILEERAIYRMAHIKLANPRRALYSQVLLSNFMYSYLAKVQQMHPQMQIPQSALQKKQEAERKQKELEQQRQQLQQLQQQQQQQQGGDQYKYDYHQGITQYVEPGSDTRLEGAEYIDNSHTYNHDHHDDPSHGQHSSWPYSQVSQHTQQPNGYGDQGGHGQYDRNGKDYYQRHKHEDEDDEDDMW